MPTTIKVFGNIKDVSRFAKRCTVEIKLINGPINEDPNLIVPTELVRQTDETGYFEAPLGLGNYRLLIGGDQILFSVTDLGSGDKNIVSLLNDDLSYTRDPYNSNWNGLRQGNIQFLYVAAPKVFSAATFDSLGAHVPGLEGTQYQYFCTFLTALGETPASPFITEDLTSEVEGTCLRLTFNVADVIANVTKRRVWRSTTDEFQEFQVIAELDPTVATFDDVLPYGGYPGGVAPIPDHNTTAGAIYAINTKVAQVSPETGFDFSFRVALPYGQTLAFDREATLNHITDSGVSVPVLKFQKNAALWTIGKVFGGFNQPGIVPNPVTGYTGTRVLQENGTWVEQTGGGGSPGGSPSNIQFNDSGAFNGSDNFTYDGAFLVTLSGNTTPTFKMSQADTAYDNQYCGIQFDNSTGLIGFFSALSSNYGSGASGGTGTFVDDGSGHLTGTGTTFTDYFIGQYLYNSETEIGGFIASITDDTHLTLSTTVGDCTSDGDFNVSAIYTPNALTFNAFHSYGAIAFLARGANGRIDFTIGGYGVADLALRITREKNIGVGVGKPLARLHVSGGAIVNDSAQYAYGAVWTLDPTLSNVHEFPANGNATVNASTAGVRGQEITLIITNDVTSARTITFGTHFKANGNLVGTASKVATVRFVSNGTNFYETSRVLSL